MARLTSFSDFVGGESPLYNSQPKPYIYVLKYIIGKEDYLDELKEYITNFEDEESDYEDDDAFDPFMKKLKELLVSEDYDEIEEMIHNYEEYTTEDDDFDEDDDDYEEKMYDVAPSSEYDIEDDTDREEINKEIEESSLSDDLKSFLKVDIEFEDLEDTGFSIEGDEDEFQEAIDVDYEEIKEPDMDFDEMEESLDEVSDEEEIQKESKLNKEWINKQELLKKDKPLDLDDPGPRDVEGYEKD